MKHLLKIRSNEGYAADQVKAMTVGELKEMIEWLDDEDTFVLYDQNNAYGARFGRIVDIEEDYEDEDDEEMEG